MNSIKAANQVLQRTSEYIQNGVVREQPAWYRVLAQHPPKHAFNKEVRLDVLKKVKQDEVSAIAQISEKLPTGYYVTRVKPSALGGTTGRATLSQILRPQQLAFLEDELRTLFYKQHPWELADAKSLVENEHTIEAATYDWSNLRQFTKKLDGESVVQRTVHIHSQGTPLLEAYEQAKFEYYRLKIQDETAMNVAREQAEMFGHVFATTHNEKGLAEEDAVIGKWKADAERLSEVLKAKMSDSGAATVEAAEEQTMSEDDILKKVFT